ncbi:hypothetical protein N7456_009188 [Penicillium angulare]|uniref:Uncharacterized protein n=1 Tax=Penicillium angulare TaxID=116970 RepID=A0A9W9F4D3_9EURO|nr:hypothetical protein N7456_009188 [Penicillium angulare]
MHFKHILLASSLAFWSGPVAAQSGLNDLGSGLGPVEGGSLLAKRLEKLARRASVKGSTTSDDQEIAKKDMGMLDSLLGEVLPELAPSSSGAASATPTSSATPTPYDPFIKRVEMPESTKAPSPKLVKKQMDILNELESELEGLAGGGSSSAAGSSTPAPSATPSGTPSENSSPLGSLIKRQQGDISPPIRVATKLLNSRDEIPGYKSSSSDSGFDLSNGDGQNAGSSSGSYEESVDPFSQPDFFGKRQYPGEIPGYESSASGSEANLDNGDGQRAEVSSDSSKDSISDPFSQPGFFEKRQYPDEIPAYESSASHSESALDNGDGQDTEFSTGSSHEAAPFPGSGF